MQECHDAVLKPIEAMPYVRGDAYLTRVSEFAATFDIPLAEVDESAAAEATEFVADLTDPDNVDGLIVTLAFDTADDDGIENRDEDVAEGDVEAMTNPEIARIQVRDAAEALGIELSGETLDRLTTLAVSAAWVALAGWGDDDSDSEDMLEDRLDAQHALENPADDDDLGPPPNPAEIDWSTFPINPLDVENADFDGIGLCSSASGHVGPVDDEYDSCIVSTDGDAGGISSYGIGVSTDGLTDGTSGGSVGFGTIQTNAQAVDQLGGYSISLIASGGAGVGAAGTITYGIEKGADGVWRFDEIVAVQGSVTATTPGADVSYTINRTDVVWTNGAINVVRSPVEAVADDVAGGITRFFRLPHDINNAFRAAG